MWWKWTKRILIGLAITILTLFVAMVAIVNIYEDEIKQYAVSQLNAHLKVKVQAPKIDLTIWDNFPSTSLRFSDVLIPDYTSENQKDTMLFAKNIYLNFNFWDILAGNYTVQEVALSEAMITIKTNEKGEANYDIWNTDTTVVSDGKFSFDIKKLSGKNIQLNYIHEPANQVYKMDVKTISFAGNFNEKAYQLSVESDLRVKRFYTNGMTLLKNKNASLSAQINIDNNTGVYSIIETNAVIEKIKFNVNGNYTNQNEKASIDLQVKGDNIDLASLFSVFPINYFDFIKQYNAKGKVLFDAHLAGEINQEPLDIAASFVVKNGSVTEKASGIVLNAINLDGSYTSANAKGVSELVVEQFAAKLDLGSINGSFSIVDFKNPLISCVSNGNTEFKKTTSIY